MGSLSLTDFLPFSQEQIFLFKRTPQFPPLLSLKFQLSLRVQLPENTTRKNLERESHTYRRIEHHYWQRKGTNTESTSKVSIFTNPLPIWFFRRLSIFPPLYSLIYLFILLPGIEILFLVRLGFFLILGRKWADDLELFRVRVVGIEFSCFLGKKRV